MENQPESSEISSFGFDKLFGNVSSADENGPELNSQSFDKESEKSMYMALLKKQQAADTKHCGVSLDPGSFDKKYESQAPHLLEVSASKMLLKNRNDDKKHKINCC